MKRFISKIEFKNERKDQRSFYYSKKKKKKRLKEKPPLYLKKEEIKEGRRLKLFISKKKRLI